MAGWLMVAITIFFITLLYAATTLVDAFYSSYQSKQHHISKSYDIDTHQHIHHPQYHNSIASTSESSNTERQCTEETYVVEWKVTLDSDITSDSSRGGGGQFNAKIFASSNCWGKRPFLMRGAFDPNQLMMSDDTTKDDDDNDGTDAAWPSWGDVVEIATDDESESRIISHISGIDTSFELKWGPLNDEDADVWLAKPSTSSSSDNNTNKRKETLVVNDIDRFYPPLADWMHDIFHFIPNWRMDDGQISLAEYGGGIGPHVDNYDVFLIQMSGSRTWQVGRRKVNATEERDRMIDGLDVRVLGDWKLDVDQNEVEEWIVHPGDVLYLPPRVAHCGTALSNDSMTLSVGCRAPSVSDLVSKLAERLSSSIDDSAVARYTDEDLLQGQIEKSSPGEITSDAKERTKHLVLDSLTSLLDDDEYWDEFIGRYATEQKRLRNNYPIPLSDWADESEEANAKSIIQSVLAGECVLYQAEGIAFAFSSTSSGSYRFFVNGEMYQTEASDNTGQRCMKHLYKSVSNNRRLDQALLLGSDDNNSTRQISSEGISFLEQLVEEGVLYPVGN